jgi:hypothetical protein
VVDLKLVSEDEPGKVHLIDPKWPPPKGAARPGFDAVMQPARDPGDQTVPLHSADHQFHSGKFKGIFRQTGYEHQDSYKNENALRSTLYSLVRIAQTMTWTT